MWYKSSYSTKLARSAKDRVEEKRMRKEILGRIGMRLDTNPERWR